MSTDKDSHTVVQGNGERGERSVQPLISLKGIIVGTGSICAAITAIFKLVELIKLTLFTPALQFQPSEFPLEPGDAKIIVVNRGEEPMSEVNFTLETDRRSSDIKDETKLRELSVDYGGIVVDSKPVTASVKKIAKSENVSLDSEGVLKLIDELRVISHSEAAQLNGTVTATYQIGQTPGYEQHWRFFTSLKDVSADNRSKVHLTFEPASRINAVSSVLVIVIATGLVGGGWYYRKRSRITEPST